ncbi:MAG: septation protein SpoVG family protein [Firmicutes bacterium]|nr:septation protein SpoVG family protein [Bacillota bacterium]
MEITNVRIRVVNDADKPNLKAIASVIFDDLFVVHEIRILQGSKGLIIAMPNKRLKNGAFMDIANPLKAELRNRIDDAVCESYEKALMELA